MNLMKTRTSRFNLCAILLSTLLVGCGSIPLEPFQAFSKSAVQLHQGTEKALADVGNVSGQQFLIKAVKETGERNPEKMEQLRLQIDDTDPLSWKTDALFLKIDQFQDGANQLTGAFVSYAELLARLASPDLLPTETFDKLTDELNANASDALAKITRKNPDSEQVALFSTIAAEATRAYLESKRQSELENALKANQAAVDTFVGHMQEGVKIAAQITADQYSDQFQALALQMITPAGPAPESTRRTLLQNMITLDRKHIAQLGTLNDLYQAFGRIPSAHEELIRAVSNKTLSLTAINALFEAGKRLEANYDRALVVNKSKAVQAAADEALAQARLLEAEADAAKLRAATVKAEAITARAQANADPTNANKKAIAEKLEKQAEELAVLAKTKKADADNAAQAASDVQHTADQIKRKLLGGAG